MGTVKYPTYNTVLEHYGCVKDPFGEAVDPDMFYPARSHVEVLEAIRRGLEKGTYVQAIISQPGVGKTTILKLLQDRVNTSEVISHRQPKLRPWESLKYLLLRLGIASDAEDMEDLQRQFIEALEKKIKTGRSVSLIIDEAQNLGEQVLALLQSMSSTESGKTAPLKVVLAIQASSSATIRELARNDERLFELKPLCSEEVGPYIAHRLGRSGSAGQEIFTRDAIRQIAEYSRGVPREINGVCSEALRLCLESGSSRTVDERCLRQTIALCNNSYEVDVIGESNLVEPFPVKAGHSASLLDELEHWFAQHDHTWSGTRSELLNELQSHTPSSDLSAARREDLDRLLNVLEQNLPELEKNGVRASIKKGAGTPVLITLQHIDSHTESRVSIDMMTDSARPGVEENARMGETMHYDQNSAQTLASTQGESCIESNAADESAAAVTDETENDEAEALRRVLQEPKNSGDKHRNANSRRSKLLILMAVLIVLGLIFMWARQSLFVEKTKEGMRDERVTLDRTAESHDGSSSISNLMRDAESGDSASQLALATLYQSGDHVDRNDAEAVRWLQKAATQGQAEAAYRLANAYRTGQGAPQSKLYAYCWYVMAAAANQPDSEQQIKALTAQLTDRDIANVRYELGQMHLNGTGTRPDTSAAYFWFRLAEVAGHPTAKQAKESLASKMTSEQITTAAEKASKWLQVHPPKSPASGPTQSVASPRP